MLGVGGSGVIFRRLSGDMYVIFALVDEPGGFAVIAVGSSYLFFGKTVLLALGGLP